MRSRNFTSPRTTAASISFSNASTSLAAPDAAVDFVVKPANAIPNITKSRVRMHVIWLVLLLGCHYIEAPHCAGHENAEHLSIGDRMDFNQSPLLVIWEVTQACDLSCVHCRALASPERHPGELTTGEGYQLLEEIKRFGNPLVVLTGGDPLKRSDLFDLMKHSVAVGLRTN